MTVKKVLMQLPTSLIGNAFFLKPFSPLNDVINPWAYVMTKAFCGAGGGGGGLIHGRAYIRGGLYTEGKLH